MNTRRALALVALLAACGPARGTRATVSSSPPPSHTPSRATTPARPDRTQSAPAAATRTLTESQQWLALPIAPPTHTVLFSHGDNLATLSSAGLLSTVFVAPEPGPPVYGAVSPDCSSVAVVLPVPRTDNMGYDADVVVADLDGNIIVNLSIGPRYDDQPSWSPDASTVLVRREGSEILSITVATGATRVLVPNTGASVFSPIWSPDGQSIAYILQSEDGVQVRVASSTGSDLQTIPITSFVPSTFRFGWSPDSSAIALSDEDGRLHIVQVSSGTAKEIASLPGIIEDVAWSQDGLTIIFSARRGPTEPDLFLRDVYRIDSAGSDLARLTRSGEDRSPSICH